MKVGSRKSVVSSMTKKTKETKGVKGCTKGRKWWHCPVTPRPRVDKRSHRTVKRGKNLVRVACPTGKWNPKAPRGRKCRVAMVATSILKPV